MPPVVMAKVKEECSRALGTTEIHFHFGHLNMFDLGLEGSSELLFLLFYKKAAIKQIKL